MKAEKLLLVCGICNGDLEVVLSSGPLRIRCPQCYLKVEAADKTISYVRDLMEKVDAKSS